jgi:DNA processing protein
MFASMEREPSEPSARERATVFALAVANVIKWHEVSDLVLQAGSASAIVERRWDLLSMQDVVLAELLAANVGTREIDAAEQEIADLLAAQPDVWFCTVLDAEYPENLRSIYDRPPFLFGRGELHESDARSIAVVGTRSASPVGRQQARELATELAQRGVTVVSGLAKGIDAEAHAAALAAGGRTVAVLGTGIAARVYPRENEDLADRILEHGALLSQFTPTSPPRRENFPRRNVVTSGMAVGTAVIEATHTSGARMQARLALEHGKRLFLVRSLVLTENWARTYAQRPGCVVVDDVQQILDILDHMPERYEQLRLA